MSALGGRWWRHARACARATAHQSWPIGRALRGSPRAGRSGKRVATGRCHLGSTLPRHIAFRHAATQSVDGARPRTRDQMGRDQDRLLHRWKALLDVQQHRVPDVPAAEADRETPSRLDDLLRVEDQGLASARKTARRRLAAALVGQGHVRKDLAAAAQSQTRLGV